MTGQFRVEESEGRRRKKPSQIAVELAVGLGEAVGRKLRRAPSLA